MTELEDQLQKSIERTKELESAAQKQAEQQSTATSQLLARDVLPDATDAVFGGSLFRTRLCADPRHSRGAEQPLFSGARGTR